MKRVLILVIPLLSLFLLGCPETPKIARGDEDVILVVSDSTEFRELESTISTVFEKIIITPQPEQLFKIKNIEVSSLNNSRYQKNIIIAAPLNSESATGKFINSILDSAAKVSVMNGETVMISKDNLWAAGQLVVILTAPTLEDLEFQILRNSDNLVYAFQKKSDERLSNTAYNKKYRQLNVEGQLLKEFGWTIFVQLDFRVAKKVKQDNFVWLRRGINTDTERWVFVKYFDNMTPEYLNKDSIISLRNQITEKYYLTSDDSVHVVATGDYTSREVNFNGNYAIFTQGLWKTIDNYMGGPFISYTFYDTKTKRIYMVDGSLFAPKHFKRNLIQQTDVMLQSFKLESQLDEKIKDELMKLAGNN